MALGHQIGMAVENSYLVQQTARRSEELHILNEIGRALSSTLDLDSLLEHIYSEMERLVGRRQLFHRLFSSQYRGNSLRDRILDGARVPKRSRPSGNHLTEYVIRTQQPLLIRERFGRSSQLGLEPLQETSSICAVPLILYDRAVGVMVVHSHQGGRIRRGPSGTLAGAGQRSRNRHRERAVIYGGAEKIAPSDAD